MSFPASPPSLDGVTHADVSVRRVRWHVATAGEGPPVVLLHGWPQHWWAWRRVIPILAERHRVVVPDLRGFGWSEAPEGRYGKMGLACDVLDLLDVLEIERCTLVGHDWGGFVAQLAALRAPERVERLVALNILTLWPPLATPTPLDLLRSSYTWVLSTPFLGEWAQRVGGRGLEELMKLGSGRAMSWDPDDLRLYASAFTRPAHARAASALYRTFLTREMPALAAGRYGNRRLEVPGVYATGRYDPVITPDRFEGVGEHAPNMTTAVIEGAGHWTPEERPHEVATLILGEV